MHDKPVALVTGADKDIGLRIAKDLAAHGFTVHVGSRDLERGEQAAKGVGADACALQLDVADQASVAAAAARIRNEWGRLDVLVNNAAISHAGGPGTPFEEIQRSSRASVASPAAGRAVFETNVFGVLAVTQALLPLLRGAPAGRVVNVSRGAGSLTRNADPGFTWTDLNNQGAGTVEAGAREAVRLALLGADGPTGTFSSSSGPTPW